MTLFVLPSREGRTEVPLNAEFLSHLQSFSHFLLSLCVIIA
jgi:hypothetical protein